MIRLWIPCLLLIPLGATVAGCAGQGGTWHKAGSNADKWAVDRATCQSLARRDADDDYRAGADYDTAGGVNDQAGFKTLMRRHDGQRNTQALYERCLKRKGYSKSPPATPKGKQA